MVSFLFFALGFMSGVSFAGLIVVYRHGIGKKRRRM